MEPERNGAKDSDEISLQPRKRAPFATKISKIMGSHGRELVFGLAVILSAYAAFQNRPLKTRKVAFPEPFFSKNSLVNDYFWGNVIHAFERMQDSDITFVMYYAPWDAMSMDVRWEFEKTAKYYHEQVNFAAINCWWPESECRHHFPKISSFPILIAYQNNGKGVQFQGNPNFPQLVRFLDHIIKPITIIHSRQDLLQLMVKHNVVVLGFLNFQDTPQPAGYFSFYTAAVKALERDPDRVVGFALVSNKADAAKFGLNTSKAIHLYLWNSTQAFVSNDTFSSHKILDWIFKKKAEVIRWLSPPGVKSLLLSSILENSPTLIMLTPRYVTASLVTSPFYYMFKEVALDYYNCNSSSHVNNIIRSVRQETKYWNSDEDIVTHQDCAREKSAVEFALPTSNTCCHSVAIENVQGIASYNDTVCSICLVDGLRLHKNNGDTSCQGSAKELPSIVIKAPLNRCFVHAESKLGRYSMSCCQKAISSPCYPIMDSKRGNPDRLSSRFACMLLNHSLVVEKISVPTMTAFAKKPSNFTGMGCRINKTLAFVAMDSLQFNLFFERLGVNVLKTTSKTAMAIVDAEELHYTLNKEITIQNIREFILNYTLGYLQRHSRSSTIADFTQTDSHSDSEIIVKDISSQNFNTTIMDDTKDVVLLVYAPWCTFCYGISHVYLTVARYFQATKDIVFLRINGDANDLPWEFTVQKYPTIILFPAKKKADSVSFPEDLPITVTNLIHFVLTHSKREIKLQTALSLCSAACILHNRKLALSNIRHLLHRFRTSRGRLGGVQGVLQEDCKDTSWATGLNRTRIANYMEYAAHLADEMCDIRTQLGHAKTLHLTLCTTEGDQLTRGQLETILDSHGGFSNALDDNRCQDLRAALNVSLKACRKNVQGKQEE